MENTKAQKLLNKIQRDLMQNGIITNTLVEDLKELRPYVVAEKKPLLAKTIRLTFEHIENYQGFYIPIPQDEPIEEEFEEEEEEEEEEEIEEASLEETEAKPEESLEYLLSLIEDSENKRNELDLREYCAALGAYAEDN